MRAVILSLILSLAATAVTAADVYICVSDKAPDKIRAAAATLTDSPAVKALLQAAGAQKAELIKSERLLADKAYNDAANHHLIVVGIAGQDPLLQKVMGHQAMLDSGKREFYRLGHGRWQGSIGYIEGDWNPFLFSDKFKTNAFSTEIIKITGTDEPGVLAAVNAVNDGALNAVVWTNDKPRNVETSLLDFLPEYRAAKGFPASVGNLQLAGLTYPDAIEYRAWIDWGGTGPKQIVRAKYLNNQSLTGVSAVNWANGFHRMAFGNAVNVVTFAGPEEAQSAFAAVGKFKTAATAKLNNLPAWVMDQPKDEAFTESGGKIYYVRLGNRVIASTLPLKETEELLTKLQ